MPQRRRPSRSCAIAFIVLAQYISVSVCPDICAPVQHITPGADPTTDDEYATSAKVRNFLLYQKETKLTFVPLYMDSAKRLVISGARFANARGGRSQLGFQIFLTDKHNNANIIHYA